MKKSAGFDPGAPVSLQPFMLYAIASYNGSLIVAGGVLALGGDGGLNLDQFLGDHRADHLLGDLAAVVEDALRRNDPLPHLRAGDFGGGGVFHQVVDGHAAVAGQPGAKVVDADVDIVAQAGFGDRGFRTEVEPLGRAEVAFNLLFPLVRLVAEDLDEFFHGDRHQARVSHPAAVEAVVGVAGLVVTDAGQGLFVGDRVVLDRDQGRHAAHGRGAALVASLDEGQGIAAHEGHFHGDGAALGQAEILVLLELLDAGEDVVTATGVQTGRVVAQFVEDFFHLEGGENGFNQHGGLDGALRQTDVVLGHNEGVIPQAGFEVAFHLRQVVERAGATGNLFLCVVEEDQTEVEQAAGNALAIDQHVLLVEVPAARTDLQGGDGVVELVFLAVLVLERQFAADRLVQIDLTLDLVVPVRGVGILEVGHVGVSAGVEGVDDHLGFDRAGDFGAATLQGLGQRGDLPVTFADVLGFRQEVRHFAGINAGLALDAGLQQFLAAAFEGAVQLGDQFEGFEGQDGFVTRLDVAGDLHALGQVEAHEKLLG